MLKSKFAKLNELGSLMVEAMAMLALISMVTPILYRKAAERTTELQDINAAGQMRSLIKAVDDYVSDNYNTIVAGNAVNNSVNNSVNYSDLVSGGKKTIDIKHFRDYLPYGFLDSSGNVQDTKTFSKDYKVVFKYTNAGGRKAVTAFVVAEPKEKGNFPMLRASRIASMVGTNGGYAQVSGGKVMVNGVQGIWTIDNMSSELGVTTTNGSIVTSSVQPITEAGGGGNNENYLYRIDMSGNPSTAKLNQMEANLKLGADSGTHHNISNINQLIISAQNQANFSDKSSGNDGALLIKGSGGATIGGNTVIGGALSALADKFKVNNSGLQYGTLFTVTDSNLKYGENGSVINASASDLNLLNGKITVNSSGTKINSKTNIAGDTVIGDLNASVNSTDGVANKLTVKGNADVTGIFTAGEIRTPKFKSLTLDAGAAAYTGPWNLHVEATKASFAQPDFNVATDKLKITSAESSMKNATITLNANDVAKAVLNSSGAEISSTNNVKMHGNNSVHLYTGAMNPSLTANEVSIQDTMFRANRGTIAINSIVNSFTVKNTDGSKLDQTDISGAVSRVRNMNFQVEEPGGAYVLKVEPQNANKSKVKVDGELIVYNDNATGDSGEKLLQVSQASNNSGGNATAEITRGKVIVKDNGTTVKKVLTVDANETDKSTADRGSVYIRKGIVELESSYGTKLTDAQVQAQATSGNDKGYVRADRFVSNRGWTNPITGGVVSSFNRGTTYDAYQVNPAYTSVMHDIKLTSRGGARLSDILPDFINKGIYVVDNTYLETFGSWENSSGCPSKTSGNSCQTVSSSYVANNHTDWTSPWLGVVPAPMCPPGYAKVITITPAGFAMAQAGVPGTRQAGKKQDIVIINYPKNPNEDYSANPSEAPSPLYFQKSTWLRAKVYTHGSDNGFKGWSAIMGFMYPYTYYKKYMDDLGLGLSGNDAIAWNLFPVFRKQLEAYATVYCYFDRKGGFGTTFDSNLVDTTYDQLSNFRAPMSGKSASTTGSDSGYFNRLNDPNLKYTEPW